MGFLSVLLKPLRGSIAAIRRMGRKVYTASAYLWVVLLSLLCGSGVHDLIVKEPQF